MATISYCQAQYISRSEPVPFNCPSVCPGATIILKVGQIQNLNAGDVVQALLSDASGSFASGTTVLNSSRYSTNSGTSWTVGSYIFSSNVNNLYFEITLPVTTPVGSNYTIKMQSSSGYISTDLFQCSGGNKITVTAAYSTIPSILPTASGVNTWNAHVYTWTATTSQLLTTTALVNAQNFFDPLNYKGHFIKNSLNFDLDYTANGGNCPGPNPALNDGTSISCANSYSTNFSIRFRRTENFAPGFYKFEIQGDDGIRLSLDGGATWILSSFFEQLYTASYQTTSTAFPTGVCLSGSTDLIVECFQRPADCHFKFTSTFLAGLTIVSPPNQTICAGAQATFPCSSSGTNFQWYMSSDGGLTYNAVANSATYSGSQTNTLSLTSTPANLNANLYKCEVTGLCSQSIFSSPALLTVSPSPTITTQPANVQICDGQNTAFTIGTSAATGLTFQWQVNTGSGFNNIAGANSSTYNISGVSAAQNGNLYQCVVSGCGGTQTSTSALLSVTNLASIVTQPQNLAVCVGDNGVFSLLTQNATNYQWQINSGAGFQNLVADATYSGVNSNVLSITNMQASMNGNTYQCLVTGCNGNISSVIVTISIGTLLAIITQPMDVSICENGNAHFSVIANSVNSYQWQVDDGTGFVNLVNNGVYANVTSSNLQISNASLAFHNFKYRCVLNGCHSVVNSDPATLHILSKSNFTKKPNSLQICVHDSGYFKVSASLSPTFQWQIKQNGSFISLSNNIGFGGTQTDSLFWQNLPFSLNGSEFRCQLNSCDTVYSNSVFLTLIDIPKIISSPANQFVCGGTQTVQFLVNTSNASSFSWQISTDKGITFTPISNSPNFSGENSTLLTLHNITSEMDGYMFRCEVTGCNTALLSGAATLHICKKTVPFFIPNSFSPNGDLVNDYFQLYTDSSQLKYVEVKIFNRWGEKVFESNDLDFKWDGTYKNVTQDPGIYTYSMAVYFLDGQSENNLKGSITLIK